MMRAAVPGFVLLCALSVRSTSAGGQHEHTAVEGARMGRVQFSNSCSEAVKEKLDLAIATLHSFGYRKAGQLFETIAQDDPSCGHSGMGCGDEPLPATVGPADTGRSKSWMCRCGKRTPNGFEDPART